MTARCWAHALRNALAHKVMHAPSANVVRLAFQELKAVMGSDAERAVRCFENALGSLLTQYQFEKCF